MDFEHRREFNKSVFGMMNNSLRAPRLPSKLKMRFKSKNPNVIKLIKEAFPDLKINKGDKLKIKLRNGKDLVVKINGRGYFLNRSQNS